MKQFNETMIKDYLEFNNAGQFVIEGHKVKFYNQTKTLETDYKYADELRIWWFNLTINEDVANERIYFKSKYDIDRMLNEIAPYGDCRNLTIAKAIANGNKDKITDKWLVNGLIRDNEEGLIDYEQSVKLYEIYKAFLKKTFVKINNIQEK